MEGCVQKVLIAEDNFMIAEMAEDVLLANGYEVCGIAATASEGVALCRLHNPNLAIIDLQLADGQLGTSIAAQLPPLGKLGILYATGNRTHVALTAADGHACISKPYTPSDLLRGLQLVTQIVATGTAVSPCPPGFQTLLPASTGNDGTFISEEQAQAQTHKLLRQQATISGRGSEIVRDGQKLLDDIAPPLLVITGEIQRIERLIADHIKRFRDLQRPADRPRTNGSSESRLARRLLAARRQREQIFEGNLFGEPAWDILLDLFVAHDERINVSVSSLCIAAAVPPSTGLRWLTNMTAQGILVRRQDPEDARRVWIELVPHVAAKMRSLLQSWENMVGD